VVHGSMLANTNAFPIRPPRYSTPLHTTPRYSLIPHLPPLSPTLPHTQIIVPHSESPLRNSLMQMNSIHYAFEDLGISLNHFPDTTSVYIVQDAYTRQFYPDSYEKFLMVAEHKFDNGIDSLSFSRNHGIIDTLTGLIALRYDEDDCSKEERDQFDTLCANELTRMITRKD